MAKVQCETCNGKGEAVFSCCTGEVVNDDIMMCPSCYEHLGEEECPDCEGTGAVEEDTQLTPKTEGVNSRAEAHRDHYAERI